MSKFFSKKELCPQKRGLKQDPNTAGLNNRPILTAAFVPSFLHLIAADCYWDFGLELLVVLRK